MSQVADRCRAPERPSVPLLDPKVRLRHQRPPRVVENDEYAAFARRVSAGDIEAITCMAALADDIEQADSIPATLSVSYL